LKHVWNLVRKDLLRDARHPWGLAVFMVIPVVTAMLIALVFSPKKNVQDNVTIELAVLDRDDDFLSGMLRSLSGQSDASRNLHLHFVETEQEGIALIEKQQVSALVVLPEHLTRDLLNGSGASLTLYKNPAQTILPIVVQEGLNTLAVAISAALDLVQPEVKALRDMTRADHLPHPIEAADMVSGALERLRIVEPYLFPPLIQFQTIKASEYVPTSDPNQVVMEDPNP